MKEADRTARDKKRLFGTAEKVFSKSFVDMIRDKGQDFLEVGSEGSYITDADGRRFIDCYTSAGTFNLGRRNPVITASLKQALFETDQGNFVMPSQEKALLARRISDFVPGSLECVLFGVTRGESMEAAVKLARGFTGRSGIITVDKACYGESGFALSLSERPGKEQFGSLIPDIGAVPFGDIDAARQVVNRGIAAFVMEPVQAENHCRTADLAYYAYIRSLCTRNGVKLIFDETQSGFGRTGKKFFFEHIDVIPDILIVGEAITGGLFPMTAMVFTQELKHFFDIHPLIHLCTFGGHDLGCRAAMTALDEYDRRMPWKNAEEKGERMLAGLKGLVRDGQPLRSVSGKGLLLSLKFASPEIALAFSRLALGLGLLTQTGRVDASCVLLRPDLLIGGDTADMITDITAKALEALPR